MANIQQLFDYYQNHEFAWVCGFAIGNDLYEHIIYLLNVETIKDKKALDKIRKIIRNNDINFSASGLHKQQFYGNYFQDQMDEVEVPCTICNNLQEVADALDYIIKDSKKHPKKYSTQKLLTEDMVKQAQPALQQNDENYVMPLEDDRCYQ